MKGTVEVKTVRLNPALPPSYTATAGRKQRIEFGPILGLAADGRL
jgi:hypothetical protein